MPKESKKFKVVGMGKISGSSMDKERKVFAKHKLDVEAVEGRAHAQTAPEFYHFDAIQSFRLDIQVTCLQDHEILQPLRVDSRKGLC